jgi:hypothetical protein
MPDQRSLRTYTRKVPSSPKRPSVIDGLRKSLAEVERRILLDISNSQAASAPRISAVSLQSPGAIFPELVKPNDDDDDDDDDVQYLKPISNDENVSNFQIYEDKPERLVASPQKHLSSIGLSDDLWSPSKIASHTGIHRAPIPIPIHHKPPIQSLIDFDVPPRALKKIWVRHNPELPSRNNLPDHFQQL